MKYYLKYAMKYELIHNILQKTHKKKINIYMDILSICRGFYNKDVVFTEIRHYMQNQKPSNILIEELRQFMNNLYTIFNQYDPFFILFYDDGYCSQNKSIFSAYKSGISTLELILEDEYVELFREIKKYYFNTIPTYLEKQDHSKIFYLKEYESDLIPHYCIDNDLYDSKSSDILNIILSVDKDLMQTAKFNNTVVCATTFLPKDRKIHFGMYDNQNAISYFYKDFKIGILDANYIPLLLSLIGDKSDNIPKIEKGLGIVKAYNLIVNNNIPHDIIDIKLNIKKLPDIIQNNITDIERNYNLISFDQQIKRLPKNLFKTKQ